MEGDNKFGSEDGSDWSIESNYKSMCETDGKDKEDEHNDNPTENLEDEVEQNIGNLTHEEIMSMNFETLEEAEDFYRKLGKVLGFGIRRDNLKRDGKGETIWRQLVCDHEGFRAKKHFDRVNRKREERLITRTGCKAHFRALLDRESGRWHVSRYDGNHNHELTGSKYSHLIRSHRQMTNTDKALASVLRSHGMKPSKIMSYIANQAGGYENVTFTRRDLYNHFDRERKAQVVDGDGVAALSYLCAKSDIDPMFHVSYTLDQEDRLANLFWTDGIARMDYQYFSDVIAFDSTYRKNVYNKPLVIFSSLNHHGKIVIFGAALLVDETEETYKWVLRSLTNAMANKHPVAVITDGDKAMRKAIKELWPQACHRLCAWHLQQNAKAHVHKKEFLSAFAKCMYRKFEVEEFERMWADMVANFELENNEWIRKLYKKKKMWANAYLRNTFFAGINTTSQCEGINSFIKDYVTSRHNLVEFLRRFDQAIQHYRNNEFNADFESKYHKPVLKSALHCIESSAAEVYTLSKFKEFREQLMKSAACIVGDRMEQNGMKIWKLTSFDNHCKSWEVSLDYRNETFKCSCCQFESCGIACSHIICIMKEERFQEVPKSLILNRWTKLAKTIDLSFDIEKGELNENRVSMLRRGTLLARCSWMCFLAGNSKDDFNDILEVVDKKIHRLESVHGSKLLGGRFGLVTSVKDPALVGTKGRPAQSTTGKKRLYLCSLCNRPGHNKSTCTQQSECHVSKCTATQKSSLDSYTMDDIGSPSRKDSFFESS